MTKFTLNRPQGAEHLPQWLFTALRHDDGRVFAPAAICGGNEKMTMLAAMHDNTTVVEDEGHVYVPTSWIAEYCPKEAEVCAAIEARVTSAV